MSRGIHTLPNEGRTVDWLTPPDLLEALGSFDLDPCCHPVQADPVSNWDVYALQRWHNSYGPFLRHDPAGRDWHWKDGLKEPWHGRVWLNPPYGRLQRAFLRRLVEHGKGTALLASRTETEVFHRYVWDSATAVYFLEGRLHYWTPEGLRARGNAGHGSVLVAYGDFDAGMISIAVDSGAIKGRMVYLK